MRSWIEEFVIFLIYRELIFGKMLYFCGEEM